MSNERILASIFDSFYSLASADRIKSSWNFQRCWGLVRKKNIEKLAQLFKAWEIGTCSKPGLSKNAFSKNVFSTKLTVFTRWGKVTEIQHIHENHIHCSNFGSLAGWQNKKYRKIFVFLGTKFWSLKMRSKDLKNPNSPNLFFP